MIGSSTQRVIDLIKQLLHTDCSTQTTCLRSAEGNSVEQTKEYLKDIEFFSCFV